MIARTMSISAYDIVDRRIPTQDTHTASEVNGNATSTPTVFHFPVVSIRSLNIATK